MWGLPLTIPGAGLGIVGAALGTGLAELITAVLMMYIAAYGVFIGTGDTLLPSAMNLFSIWAVRLTLAAWLAPIMGLQGVWIAMCIELCFRGAIFLVRLRGEKWIKKI